MKQILVYGDSLSWGIIPGTRDRFAFEQRWPGVLERLLQDSGTAARVVEDCLNGRRTACDDPNKPGRNGWVGLEQRIEVNSPLALVIIMLGTNDFQAMHELTVLESAQGVKALVGAIRRAPLEPGMPVPTIMVVAPPKIQKASGAIAAKFEGAEKKASGLSGAIQAVAEACDCHFFDAGSVTQTSRVDGVHLDADQHRELGLALSEAVGSLLGKGS